MNIVVLPIVVAVMLMSIIGVYFATTSSEYEMTEASLDAITDLTMIKNEVLHAEIYNGSLSVQSHSAIDSEIFLIDFVLNDNTIQRIIYSDDDSFDSETTANEIRKSPSDAPRLEPGADVDLDLHDLGVSPSDISSASILTDNGNRFLIDFDSGRRGDIGTGNGTGANDGKGDGQSMLDGMGIHSRLIQIDHAGSFIHGEGVVGTESSVKPYLNVNSSTNFVSFISNEDKVQRHVLPRADFHYDVTGDSLVKIRQSILPSSENMTIGDAVVRTDDDGYITVSGNGALILKFDEQLYNKTLSFNGNIAGDGSVKIINFGRELIPEPDRYELFGDGSYRYHIGTISHPDPQKYWHFPSMIPLDNNRMTCDSRWSSSLWEVDDDGAHYYYFTTSCYPTAGYPFNMYNIHATWSPRYSIEHSDGIGTAHMSTPALCQANPNHVGCRDVSVEGGYIQSKYSRSVNGEIKFLLYPDLYTNDWNYVSRWINPTQSTEIYEYVTPSSIFVSWVGDKMSCDDAFCISGHISPTVNRDVTIFDKYGYQYLVIEPNGGTVRIGADGGGKIQEFNDLKIKVPESTAYKLIQDGNPIASGVSPSSSSSSYITFEDLPVSNVNATNPGLLLKLYPDSLVYRGGFSTVVMDATNHETVHIPTEKDLVYVPYTYAMIPVTGNVTVSGLSLDGTLPLPYLNGNYTDGDTIRVPIVPGYDAVRLSINSLKASLAFGNVVGGTGVHIADPTSSVIKRSDVSLGVGPVIKFGESTAGTVSYAIASSNGHMKAIIQATVSGSVEIKNSYTIQPGRACPPPPPPPPPPRDPLSVMVDVHVNGVLVDTVDLGVDANPVFSPAKGHYRSDGNVIVYQNVKYEYKHGEGASNRFSTVSVPVQRADYVEFFVYAHIYGELVPLNINTYLVKFASACNSAVLVQSSSSSVATATIHAAAITTDL